MVKQTPTSTTLRCEVCRSAQWIASEPGSERITTRMDDPKVLLIKPKPEVRQRVWCLAHWPWLLQQAHKPRRVRA